MAEGSWRVCLVSCSFDFCSLVFLFVLLYFGGVISLQVQKPPTKSSKVENPKIWGISLSNSGASLRHQRSSVDGCFLAQDPLGVATSPPVQPAKFFSSAVGLFFPLQVILQWWLWWGLKLECRPMVLGKMGQLDRVFLIWEKKDFTNTNFRKSP